MLTHVVLMKFTDPADGPEAKKLLEGLVGAVDEIAAMTVGLDVVRSGVSHDLCMITTHASVAELRGYQEHPAHLEVAGWLRPRLAARVCVDFES
ncbi:Dabb family protein [Spirillospora sp. NPDC047279]|uniref:Dabb family protein n=1 Tax=Spirillospora sp. NPDC047279 TaxID=3155478 RepID=UPI0033E1EABA